MDYSCSHCISPLYIRTDRISVLHNPCKKRHEFPEISPKEKQL